MSFCQKTSDFKRKLVTLQKEKLFSNKKLPKPREIQNHHDNYMKMENIGLG